MSMTTLLTLSAMFGSLTTVTPPISYTTKMDVWMVGCIVFVFATLFEFTIVIFLKYYLVDLPAMTLAVGGTIQAWVSNSEEEDDISPMQRSISMDLKRKQQQVRGERQTESSEKSYSLLLFILLLPDTAGEERHWHRRQG